MIIPIFAIFVSVTYRLLLEPGMLLSFVTDLYNAYVEGCNALKDYELTRRYKRYEKWCKPLLTCVTCYTLWAVALSTLFFRSYCNDLYYWVLLSLVVVPIGNMLLWLLVKTMIFQHNTYLGMEHFKPTFISIKPIIKYGNSQQH